MNNEQYLILSYFVIGVACGLLGIIAHAYLRGSFNIMCKKIFSVNLGSIMRKVLPTNLVLFAVAGFFSVSLRSCNKQTYESIVADKTYLIAKNQEQLAASMLYICVALLLFGLLISISQAILGVYRQKDNQG